MADTAKDLPPPPGSAAEKLDEAKASEHEIVKESRKGGAAAFEFDPKATPAEKAAQAKKVQGSRQLLTIVVKDLRNRNHANVHSYDDRRYQRN